jgi:hypothetical protein
VLCVGVGMFVVLSKYGDRLGRYRMSRDYYEQPGWEPALLAYHSVDGVHAEVLQLDEDGEYFCANVYRIVDGLEDYLNNTGSVSFGEAFQAFGWDLDCFLGGASLDSSMFTPAYEHLVDDGLGGQD